MKKFFKAVLAFLNINSRRDLPIFLLSLLVAFIACVFVKLADENNNIDLTVPVKAACYIEGHSDISSDIGNVTAKCNATGYRIMQLLFRKPVTVEFKFMRNDSGDDFYLLKSDLYAYSDKIFGEKVKVENFLTDTLRFTFPFEANKRVPVVVEQNLEFKPQYMAVGGLILTPDSVTVYGEPQVLETVKSVPLVLKKTKINQDLHDNLKIESSPGLRFSDKSVGYTLHVIRYVEITEESVPLTVRNVPEDKHLTPYPSSVRVTLKCRFPASANLDSTEFYVDYDEFASSLRGKCVVRSAKMPNDVVDFTVEPEVVECIVSEQLSGQPAE